MRPQAALTAPGPIADASGMPSWAEIQEYARSKYILQNDEDDWFALVFEFNSGRTQKIRVQRFTAFDEEWIEFRSVVCKGTELPTKVALRKNAEIVIGTLALDADEDYVMIHNAPLSSLDLVEFERPLHVIARTADDLEQSYSEGNDDW
jgi:hypothetical protein